MQPENLVHGVVLAGGRSSRLGKDKALLEFRGETLLELKCRSLAQVLGVDQNAIWVSGERAGYRSIPDLHCDLGPLGAFEATFAKLSDWVLLVPVDQPLLSERALALLLEEALRRKVSLRFSESELPWVVSLKDGRAREEVRQLLAESQESLRSVRELQRRLGVERLAFPGSASEELFNLNTVEDLKKLGP